MFFSHKNSIDSFNNLRDFNITNRWTEREASPKNASLTKNLTTIPMFLKPRIQPKLKKQNISFDRQFGRERSPEPVVLEVEATKRENPKLIETNRRESHRPCFFQKSPNATQTMYRLKNRDNFLSPKSRVMNKASPTMSPNCSMLLETLGSSPKWRAVEKKHVKYPHIC